MPVGSFHTHNVAGLRLVVVGLVRSGPKLTAARVDGEGICVCAFQAVVQRGVLGICGAHRVADILDACRVFGKAARGTRSICEHWTLIVAGTSRARWRPIARAFVVACLHLHLIARARAPTGDGRDAFRAVVCPGGKAAAVPFAVPYVVVVNVGAGICRLGPGYGQAGGRCR